MTFKSGDKVRMKYGNLGYVHGEITIVNEHECKVLFDEEWAPDYWYYKKTDLEKLMTPDQEKHLEHIKIEFSNLVDPKYRKGQEEHGGDLFDYSPEWYIEQALLEAVDQVVYLLSARDAIRRLKKQPIEPNRLELET